MKKRLGLKLFRIKHNLTQQAMATCLKVSRTTYIAYENGIRNPPFNFWERLQAKFNVSDSEMWELQRRTS